jgi:pre-mRNA-processing factor 6
MIKSAKLEWALNNLDEALKLLEEAIKVFGDYAKLHMMKGQIEEQMRRDDDAYNTYTQGVTFTLL